MDQLIDDEVNKVQYIIKVNGVAVSAAFDDRMVAEMSKNNLPEEQRLLAEVVAVTTNGQQVLYG